MEAVQCPSCVLLLGCVKRPGQVYLRLEMKKRPSLDHVIRRLVHAVIVQMLQGSGSFPRHGFAVYLTSTDTLQWIAHSVW